MADDCIPVIDRTVKHIGVSKLRGLNASTLKETNDTFVIQENDTPLAVLLTYEKFLVIQDQLMSVFNTLELVSNEDEVKSVIQGLDDLKAGRTRSLREIRAELKDRG